MRTWILGLDGAEITAVTTCGSDNCSTCQSPRSELANTEETWPLKTVCEKKKAVEDALAKLLNADGTVKEGCKIKVCRDEI